MNPHVTVTIQQSPTGPTTTLGRAQFVESTEKPSLLQVEKTFHLSHGRILYLSGNVETANGMLSLAGFLNGVQICLITIKWDIAAPYFGFLVTNVGWVHLYFEKEPS